MEEVLTSAQKKEIITSVTEAMVKIEGETMRPVNWVIIEEVRSGQWGIGGQPMATQPVVALAHGKAIAAV